MASTLLTSNAMDTVAAAIFEKPGAMVMEAYSGFDTMPLEFASAAEFAEYARARIATPRGSASFFVLYPDMAGRAVRETIHLDASTGHKLRYTWQGWGLIQVLLERGDQPGAVSRIAANSEQRAAKWASTKPLWDPPQTWDWKAVASHTRRLQRALKKATQS